MTQDNCNPDSLFSRQVLLPEIGPGGQHALTCAHVAVVGLGAVGGRTAELLCRAGVGRMTIIDRDFVEVSNLPRQILYTWKDAEETRPKPETFRQHLNKIMPECHVYPKMESLSPTNVDELLHGAHVVADGTDNMETRYVINDWCIANGVPWVYAGAVGTKASVFPILWKGGCLRCVFPDPPRPEDVPTCDPVGILGPAAALAGALSATLVMKIILGDPPAPVWQTWDIWTGEQGRIGIEELKLSNEAGCPVCGPHPLAPSPPCGEGEGG